ncbi:GNAT family N-acetyltransferase [Inquilinus limosus]|uniref:GCN5 family acetyltransferase n=1 Tax=Inquilinus limosus MP06 TaxID=1398085 RepID=A0A0A0DEY3_9PROT|nr:GNAT family N-acetyltransferase [Inquilinus limosus]KGM35557.1 GCN5 family acetyltransferase [Inquilinus limosus MP06]
MTATLIAPEPPRQDAVLDLIRQSDALMASLYPAESNHMLDIASLERPEVRFFVARREGRVVGCGALVVGAGGEAELKRMFVDPATRGLKVGRDLLARIEGEARGLGVRVVRLETGIHQPEAIGLYRRFGYEECGPFGDYRPDPLSLFMEKPLD